MTLTYGRDEFGNQSHTRSAILTYSDVQKFFKQLKNRGFKARYFAVGEYGSAKGRTHWHIIVFWQNKIPTVLMDYGGNSWHRDKRDVPVPITIVPYKRMNIPIWPHGFSQWDPVKPGNEKGSIRYACKYINKDFDDKNWQGKLAMSKKPPLGAAYFEQRAQRFVDEGVSPQDPYYVFPDDARRKDGSIIKFKLERKSLDLFCAAYLRKFKEQSPEKWWPPSVMLDEYEDRENPYESGGDALKGPDRRWSFNPPMGFSDRDIYADPNVHEFLGGGWPRIDTENGPMWYGPNKEGKRAWRETVPEIEGLKGAIKPQARPFKKGRQYPERYANLGNQALVVQWFPRSPMRWAQARVQPRDGPRMWLLSDNSLKRLAPSSRSLIQEQPQYKTSRARISAPCPVCSALGCEVASHRQSVKTPKKGTKRRR